MFLCNLALITDYATLGNVKRSIATKRELSLNLNYKGGFYFVLNCFVHALEHVSSPPALFATMGEDFVLKRIIITISSVP